MSDGIDRRGVCRKAEKEQDRNKSLTESSARRHLIGMVKRTRARSITDDLAFPVRVKVVVPPHGLGRTLDRMLAWLKTELPSNGYAQHSATGFACHAAAFYFRTTEDAHRFVTAFPDAELADGTLSPSFYSPTNGCR